MVCVVLEHLAHSYYYTFKAEMTEDFAF